VGRRFCRQQYRGCEELDFASKRKMSKSEILVYPLALKLQKHTGKIKLTHPKELYALRSRFDVRLLLFYCTALFEVILVFPVDPRRA